MQQRHFNEWPIIELHEEVDSFQTSLKLLFTSQRLRDGFGVLEKRTAVSFLLWWHDIPSPMIPEDELCQPHHFTLLNNARGFYEIKSFW